MPVFSVKLTKAMKREQAIVYEALSSCFFFFISIQFKNWGRTDPKCKKGSHKPKLDLQNSQRFFFWLFIFNKDRLEQNWQTSRRTNVEARKYLLGNGKNGCKARPATPTTLQKHPKTAPTTTHGRSNQQASAEMTPLALSSVSCKFQVNLLKSRQLEPKAWAKGHGKKKKKKTPPQCRVCN